MQAQLADLADADNVIKEWSDYADGLTAQKDALQQQLDSLTAERDALRQQLEGLAVQRDSLQQQSSAAVEAATAAGAAAAAAAAAGSMTKVCPCAFEGMQDLCQSIVALL